MFEIFLFVNPVGKMCFQNERNITRAIKNNQVDARYHLVPISNMKMNTQEMIRRQLNPANLDQYNQLSQATFSALKDFHAVALMSNKKARKFLYQLQKQINYYHQPYSVELTKKVLTSLNISLDIFARNRQSKYIQKSIEADMGLANEFGVESTPTTIIYNYDSQQSDGILFEGCFSYNTIDQLLTNEQHDPDRYRHIPMVPSFKVL